MGGHRSRQAVGFAILVVALIGIPSTAGAGLTDIPIEGMVTDRAGRPIQGVQVSDGGRRVWTDSNGNFTIQEPFGRDYTLAASKLEYETQYRWGTAMPDAREDFSLYIWLGAELEPTLFETLPETMSLTAYTRVPTTDLCVHAVESATQTTVQLTAGSVGDDGFTSWTGSVTIPAGTAAGVHHIDYLANTCSSGIEISYLQTRSYIYDVAPPEVAILTPKIGHYYLQGEDLGPSKDGRTIVVGALRFEFEIYDDAGASVTYDLPGFQLDPLYVQCSPSRQPFGPGTTRVTCAERAFLNAEETLSVTATDSFGRTASASLTFQTRP